MRSGHDGSEGKDNDQKAQPNMRTYLTEPRLSW
jgi:hypothetical protein